MIDILLATYNGEKYLDTQIASIVHQTYTDWKLYIHDDGSTDNTVALIRKWVRLDDRIVFVDDGLVFHNAGSNFLYLLKEKSTAEYICFADQDDYWLDYKLEKMMQHFPKDENTPFMLCSACYLWDMQSGKIVSDMLFAKPQYINEILFRNGGLQGCAMMFNATLRDIAIKANYNSFSMHDLFISLIASAFGTISYMDEGLFLYRQHMKTVTVHPAMNRKTYVKDSISAHKLSPVVTNAAYKDIKTFYELYADKMNSKDKKNIQTYLALPTYNAMRRFLSLFFSNFSLNEHGHFKLLVKVLLRPYKV